MNLLEEIVANKRDEMVCALAVQPLEALRDRVASLETRPPVFSEAIRSVPMGLIAEVKRRSPSAGSIREPFIPPEIAGAYEVGGAQALSVLMDEKYFGGGAADFAAVREAVTLPMLYKEFVVDPWQVWHAAATGASVVLLIAAALPVQELAVLQDSCREAGVEVLFEVHDADEMEVALQLESPIVGINNRNLKSFVTTLDTTLRLRDRAPGNSLLISESGIREAADVEMLHREGGIGGVLVGEHLLRKDDLAQAVQDLMGGVWASS